MTTTRVTVNLPTGHCRRCRRTVHLEDTALATITRNGRLAVKGSCPDCKQVVSGWYRPTPFQELPRQGLQPVAKALVAIGQLYGFQQAEAHARARLEDLLLRLQGELNITHAALAGVVGWKKGEVAAALGAARRRRIEQNKELE